MPEPFPQALESTRDQRGRAALQRAGERRRAAPPADASLERLGSPYEIVFVNDGSRDATPRLLDDLQATDPASSWST